MSSSIYINSPIKLSIDSRRDAIFNTYDINDGKILDKINDLFKRMEEFAQTCSDIQDFETKLLSSPLSQEYTNIFTEVATKCPMKGMEIESDEGKLPTNEIIDDLSHPIKTQLNQKKMDFLRGLPIVGDVMEAKQHKDMFDKLTGKNKEE